MKPGIKPGHDLLYTLFEQHLFNALVENETSDAFLGRVVGEYLKLLSARGVITHEHRQVIEADLKEEVLEMLRKKTYGHFNLAEFRKAQIKANEASQLAETSQARSGVAGEGKKTRRNRRTC